MLKEVEEMLARFEAKDRAREEALRLSRSVIRSSSAAIRSVHRGEMAKAAGLLQQAKSELDAVRDLLRDHQDLRYAGFVDDAEQEYAEAGSVLFIIREKRVPSPEETGVELVNHLAGLGDATGELRRHILDLIRLGRPEEGERYLETIEEIYHLLMLFDYPEAIARGLRRKSDLARSMLERTRGDLTVAMEAAKLEASLRRLEDKLKDGGPGV
jgi:translin